MSETTLEKLIDEPTTPFEEIEPAPISHAELRDFPFTMGEIMNGFDNVRNFPDSYFKKIVEVRKRARDFADTHIRPIAYEVDKKVSRDPNYFHWDVMKKVCEYGFLSMMVPRAYGGEQCSVAHMSVMAEELATGCAGWASTIGVHSAGISCGLLSMSPYIFETKIRETVAGEKRGKPIIWSGAVTEPNAGTDIWDEDFLKVARIMTVAKKVQGGYVINGRKCFISNGSIATYTVISAALDPKDPAGSWTMFLVPTEAEGFSVGRVERKMGQKASPASEQIFEDVFVTEEMQIGEPGMGAHYIDLYLAGSRGPVGAIGVGIARRALEELVKWAKEKNIGGRRAIDQQSIQLAIARMAKEISIARQAYICAALSYDVLTHNLYRHPLALATMYLLPGFFVKSPAGKKFLKSQFVMKTISNMMDGAFTKDQQSMASALATIAKIKGSDVGVQVSSEAMRIMGHDAADPEYQIDKLFRDAKLTQIYEGTNQANTITLFKEIARLGGEGKA